MYTCTHTMSSSLKMLKKQWEILKISIYYGKGNDRKIYEVAQEPREGTVSLAYRSTKGF